MLKSLPSIDQVMSYPEVSGLIGKYSRETVLTWARDAISELRRELQGGVSPPLGDDGKIEKSLVVKRVCGRAAAVTSPSLKRVINATGIVIHTNLGRSPLSPRLMRAIADILGSYSNLEFDLEAGTRGSRHAHLERIIKEVTGAESGFVVNNNAAAVLVSLNTLAAGGEVIVSRGELIEIGGSFRLPDIIESGGARIREVGTTNKTRIEDYKKAISQSTALLLKVHTSNYKVVGFHQEASLEELLKLGRALNVPVMVDLGSGLLMDLEKSGISGEKPVRWYVEAGADVVTFSGDKLLGGPQAGFIVGRAEIIERIKQNPMVRALRVGKLTIAALEAMLTAYLSPEIPPDVIPTLDLILREPGKIEALAGRLARGLRKVLPKAKIETLADQTFAGGGSLPAEPLPTHIVIVEVPGLTAGEVARAFRSADVPVVGRIVAGRFCLDCRAVFSSDLAEIFAAAGAIREPG